MRTGQFLVSNLDVLFVDLHFWLQAASATQGGGQGGQADASGSAAAHFQGGKGPQGEEAPPPTLSPAMQVSEGCRDRFFRLWGAL